MKNLTLSLIVLAACFTVFASVPTQAASSDFSFNKLDRVDNDAKMGNFLIRPKGASSILDNIKVSGNYDRDYTKGAPEKTAAQDKKNGKDDKKAGNGKKNGKDDKKYGKKDDKKNGHGGKKYGKKDGKKNGHGNKKYGKDKYGHHGRGKGSIYSHRAACSMYDYTTQYDKDIDYDFGRNRGSNWGSNWGRDWGRDWGSNNNHPPQSVSVPVSGAGILSVLGIGIVGWLKRRKSL